MSDRLADLDDLLLQDTSPREAWAGITAEKVMRREIARELRHAANGLYKVDQEAVTADEKETDIRLRSVASEHEAVIELKLAGSRPASEMRNAIYGQLVTKYMASENSRSGCLLVTLAKDRTWNDPDSGIRIGPVGVGVAPTRRSKTRGGENGWRSHAKGPPTRSASPIAARESEKERQTCVLVWLRPFGINERNEPGNLCLILSFCIQYRY